MGDSDITRVQFEEIMFFNWTLDELIYMHLTVMEDGYASD